MDVLNYIYWISFVVGTGYVLFAGVMGMAGGFDTEGGDVGLDSHDFDAGAHGLDIDGHDFDIDGHDLDVQDIDGGSGAGFEGLEAEADAEHDGHHGGSHAAKDYGENLGSTGGHSPDLANFNPFSMVSMASFLAAFGGAGILATLNGTGLAISILAALAGGVVMSLLFWLVVGKWLFSLQGTSQARDIDMIGMEAEVITPLAHDKTGEIAYNLRGTRFTSPARLSTEGEVGRNEKVRIRLKKDNTVYVDRQRKLLE
ncbi:MAG: NfeD family protein [Planctomycetales bacterium]|nr:NfeD family protein [bacterium]UNM08776.1 MAG: NfeD family protein [Planctomycetales bacterium]